MIILIVVFVLAAIEIILAALFFKMLWQGGAPATREPRRRLTPAPHVKSSVSAPFATPGGTLT